ncbi:phosphotransferase [Candidatus Woesearchaeota archaeon]|nr:phosphotransferase [Candidatus Woesearchaeota archaeon]
MNLNNIKLYKKGKRGIVYTAFLNDKKVAVKEKNPDSEAVGKIRNEAEFLKRLNKNKIGPELYDYDKNNNRIIMEFIEGIPIIEYFEENDKKEILKVIEKTLKKLRTLDKTGINKEELTNPYKHIIIQGNNPRLIDFERCSFTEKPKNVTQFLQFLTSKNIKKILSRKGIDLEKKKIIELSKTYKKTNSKKDFDNVLDYLNKN